MTSADAPLFSVVIPTCHRNDALAACLERLAPGKQSLAAASYEVIVTDDGSRATSEAMLREKFPWAKWMAGPRRGPAANRNHGAKHANGNWIAFADDDCLPDATWLAAYGAALEADAKTNVLEGRIYTDRPRRSLGEVSPTNDQGGFLWSCNFAIRRELFQSLGGFDERFPYAAMEDVELAYRLRQRGEQFRFVTDAAVCHPARPAGGWQSLKRHGESTFIYLNLHPEEIAHLNTGFYLRMVARDFLRDTLPGFFRYRGAGLGSALLKHVAHTLMAAHLLFWSPTK